MTEPRGWFNSTDVDPTSSFQLTTSALNILMPGFSNAYGDEPVNVFFTLDTIDSVTIAEQDSTMGADFTLTMNFYANNTQNEMELAAIMTFNDTNFTFSAPVENMNISLQIVTVNVDKISSSFCSWGNIHTAPDKIAINNAVRAILPSVNKKLDGLSYEFPTHLGKYFLLSDLSLGYFNDYLSLGITPTFV